MKICPQCGKEVLEVARKCKHCGYWFDEKKTLKPGFRRCPVCDEVIPADVSVCPCCDEEIGTEISSELHERIQENIIENVYETAADACLPVADKKQDSPASGTLPDKSTGKSKKKIEAVFIGIGAAMTLVVIAVVIWIIVLSTRNNANTFSDKPPFPTENMTEEDSAKAVAEKWNKYHQQLDADGLVSLYGETVYYYHEYYTPEKIAQNKRELFRKYPGFWQNIYNVECVFPDSRTAKVTFSKEVTTTLAGKATAYPSYLIMNKVNGSWKITTESDEVTDANIAKRNKR